MLGEVTNWFRDTKIYSYLELLHEGRKKRKHDIRQVLISLQLRPRNWHYSVYSVEGKKLHIYDLENPFEQMTVWIANGTWGLHVDVDGHRYGGVFLFLSKLTWRKKVYDVAIKALSNSWIEKRLKVIS